MLVRDDSSAMETARLISEFQQNFEEWAERCDTHLTRKEAAALAELVLHQSWMSELGLNEELETLRERCGMSEYGWERKIIKPLKKDLEKERFKYELKALLQMDDEVERIRLTSALAPKYSMSAGQIEKAMSAMKTRTQTPEAKVLDLDELFDLEVEGLNWLIPGLLPAKDTVILAASPKVGKTLLSIDAAFAIATGESDFLGERVKQGRVLLVSTDESQTSTRNKLINRGFTHSDKGSIKILPTWDISQMSKLEEILEDFKPDLVIIDSLRRINKGNEVSENSAEFADNIYTLKETLQRYGAAGILIHHTNKSSEATGVNRLRGSSAIAGAVWGIWQLDQIPKPDPNNKNKQIIDPKDPNRILSVFPRDIEGQTLSIELNPENCSWKKLGESGVSEEEKADQETIASKILRVLQANLHKPGLSGREIIELIEGNFEDRSIYNQLSRMESKRIISSRPAPGDKRYKLYSLPNCHTQEQPSANCHTHQNSHTPPPPTPTVSDDDYYDETITTQGLNNSHQNSHQIVINSHQASEKIPHDDYSNQDVVSHSEIVINVESKRREGVENEVESVTVESMTVETIAGSWNDEPEVVATPTQNPLELDNQSKDHEMLPDNIKVIADALANEEACSSKEVLGELKGFCSTEALNAACQLLSVERRNQIENWLFELDHPELAEEEISLEEEEPSKDDSEEEEQPTRTPKIGLRIEFSIAGETFFGELAASAPNGIWYILWDKVSTAYKRMKESIGEPIPELPLTLKGHQFKFA
jgi:KaiC/GvpD/RAD55 family RecA-like ATPase